ncbi:hypothetical protein [Nocardia sp. NPDC057668]|uniref:hypothetical protein n=1 Tax=Nocardia sp. NPDC057668 TaxID=3346202 RepID=UPI00366CC5C3
MRARRARTAVTGGPDRYERIVHRLLWWLLDRRTDAAATRVVRGRPLAVQTAAATPFDRRRA